MTQLSIEVASCVPSDDGDSDFISAPECISKIKGSVKPGCDRRPALSWGNLMVVQRLLLQVVILSLMSTEGSLRLVKLIS